MNISIIKTLGFILALLAVIFIGSNLIHKVDDTEWQAVQYLDGQVEIKEAAGVYTALFPKITEYPRYQYFEFTKEATQESPTDESTRVTFNDGGTADVNVSIRIALPSEKDAKRAFHRQFNGNMENVKNAVWAHLSNVLKASGPIMSASENQASRKGEFNTIVFEQLNAGLYEMKRIEKTLEQVDEKGNPIKVFATEIVLGSNGRPNITQVSPLAQLGISVTQFSITETEYDEQTRKQFAQKKEAFLQAESSKAQREGETQLKLMTIEKGRRQVEEQTAASNLEKTKATITAQKEKEVAETEAAKLLSVAELTKKTAETAAAQKLAVAKLEREAAEEQAKQILILAAAEKERIAQAGAITEKDKLTLEIQRDTAIGVANALTKVNVPQFIINGGDAKNGGNTQDSLLNLMLLDRNGLLNLAKPNPVK
jgi:hypothetical protein